MIKQSWQIIVITKILEECELSFVCIYGSVETYSPTFSGEIGKITMKVSLLRNFQSWMSELEQRLFRNLRTILF